jgi:hypothetical protein
MAEIIRVSPAGSYPAPRRAAPRPRLPHPASRKAPSRPSFDRTQDLRPPVREEESAPPLARPVAAAPPPRTRTERTVLTVLVLGLVLNALALLRNAALTRADMLLGATVLLAGISLLVLMEVYRRTRR